MEKLLTVIIPSYNVGKYLDKNIQSLVKENKNIDFLDVIIVNDGSKDNTLEIGRKYEKLFPNVVTVIDKENGGYGSTINAGVSKAKGKYLRILDGDDWVNTEHLEYLLSFLEKCDSDVIYCDYEIFNEVTLESDYQKVCNLAPRIQYDYDQTKFIRIVMHGQLIKTAIYKDNHIKIDEHCFYTDTEYITFAVPYISTVTYFDESIYVYRIGREGQSVSEKGWNAHEKDHEIVINSLLKQYEELNPNISFYNYKKEFLQQGLALEMKKRIYGYQLMYKENEKNYRKRLNALDKLVISKCPEVRTIHIGKAYELFRKTNYNGMLMNLHKRLMSLR